MPIRIVIMNRAWFIEIKQQGNPGFVGCLAVFLRKPGRPDMRQLRAGFTL